MENNNLKNEKNILAYSNRHHAKKIIFVAAFSAFLATFNETFLNIAFSSIMSDLEVGISSVQWLATAYMLSAAVMIPVSAFLYRNIPTKKLYLISVGLLVIGSIMGALATNFTMLLLARIVQAIGTGMLIPIGMNLTLEVAPKQKLGIYMGIMGAMTTLGPSTSVIVAGVLLSFFSWHMLLWVFAVMSIICFACGAKFLTNVAALTFPKLDKISIPLIAFALIGLLYGISTIFLGNILVALIAILIGIICLVGFAARQNKITEPLINLKPLTIRPFFVGVMINMISLIVIFAMNIVLPLFMQTALGVSALGASLTLFPAILLSCVISPVAGRIYDKHGSKYLLPIGFICIGIATCILAFGSEIKVFLLAIIYIPVICGSALIIGPVQSFALSNLKIELNPHGVTLMGTGFQIAGCIGSSLFSGVYSQFSLASNGFTAVSVLSAAFALLGIILSLYLNHIGRMKLNLCT